MLGTEEGPATGLSLLDMGVGEYGGGGSRGVLVVVADAEEEATTGPVATVLSPEPGLREYAGGGGVPKESGSGGGEDSDSESESDVSPSFAARPEGSIRTPASSNVQG